MGLWREAHTAVGPVGSLTVGPCHAMLNTVFLAIITHVSRIPSLWTRHLPGSGGEEDKHAWSLSFHFSLSRETNRPYCTEQATPLPITCL